MVWIKLVGLLVMMVVDSNQWIPYHQLSQEHKRERKRNTTFSEFDKDRDGFITIKDIESLLGSLHKNSYFKKFF